MQIKPNKNIHYPKYDIVSEGKIPTLGLFIPIILFLSLLLLFFVKVSYAQEIKTTMPVQTCIPINSDSAAKIVVELEQCRIRTQELDNINLQAGELIKQVVTYKEREEIFLQKEELYKQIIELQKQQITAAETAMVQYKEHIKFVQSSYQQLLKDAKPNPFVEFFKSVLFMGAGVAAGSVIK